MNISVGKSRIDLVEPFRRAVERSIWEGGEIGIQVCLLRQQTRRGYLGRHR